MRTIPKRRLNRRKQRVGELAYLTLITNRISDRTHKVSVTMCSECIDNEHIGEEFSRQSWLY